MMLSERILFIIERISDILKVDNERNEIVTLCKELSHDERKVFMELFLDGWKRHILEISSDDEIRKIMESYPDDERKKMLRWYLSDPMEEIKKLYSDDEIRRIMNRYLYDKRNKMLRWYLYPMKETKKLYSDYKIQKFLELMAKKREKQRKRYIGIFVGLHVEKRRKQPTRAVKKCYLKIHPCKLNLPSEEFKKMYRELSDDDKEEFLHNYLHCWRNTILKYLEFRQRCFQNLDGGVFFNILTLLMEGKEVIVLSKDVNEGILELHIGLWGIYNCVRDVEAKYDGSQVLSEHDKQLYNHLSHLAHSSDDLLDRVMSNDAIAPDIHTLLQTIHDFYTYNPSSTQFKFKVVVKDNINTGGPQSVGNMKFSINQQVPSKDKQHSRPKTYGHVPNPDLVGFNHEIQILLNHLIQPHHETRVLGIVGPGGSGKTTLAKHIYHHPQINSHFASKVWVCISQSWDKTTILNSIWRQAAQNPMAPEMGYDQLVECLSQLLCSKSYLVIVDDIWSVDAWYHISPALPARSRSKVVVTTRNKFLPQRIDPGVLIVEPKQLNDEECYELFKKRALLDENVHHELWSHGVEMLKKCKGLPLAVVALAGVLGVHKRLSSWERISKRVTDKMLNMANESTQGVVKEILALSYYELPANLKPCALYLHVFPEDYVIPAQKLIEMWIAECFMDEEDEAEEHLEQLAQRCIVEVVETNHRGQVHRFRIHDLIREMFINIDKERGMVKNQELRVAPSKTLYGNLRKNFDSSMEVVERVYCSFGLASDVIIQVGEISFLLHKFPLISKSGLLEKRVGESTTAEGSN